MHVVWCVQSKSYGEKQESRTMMKSRTMMMRRVSNRNLMMSHNSATATPLLVGKKKRILNWNSSL